MKTPFTIRLAHWPADREAIRRLRHEVFVVEQQVPAELEWESEGEQRYTHVIAQTDSGDIIGTGRLQPDGRIGRMAVRRDWRRRGVGAAILQRLLTLAKDYGYSKIHLSAQVTAVDFYRRFAFEAEGGTYLDAGILHQSMKLRSSPD